MVQGAKHMKSNNAADNGGSSPQPKPQPKPKRRRKRLPRWADRLITMVVIAYRRGPYDLAVDLGPARGLGRVQPDQHRVQHRGRAVCRGARAHPAQARSYNEQLAGEATELPADQIEPYAQQLIS